MSKTRFKGQIKLPVVSQLPNRAKLKFIALQNLANDVYQGATSYFDCDESGNYDFEVYVGKHLFSMTSDGTSWTKPIEVIVEPLTAGLISIELSDLIDLQALPATDDVLVEYRSLLQEMKLEKQQSEAAKASAEASKNAAQTIVNAAQYEKRIVETIHVGGSSDFFYPVWFRMPDADFGITKLQISRTYHRNPGTLHPTHVGSLLIYMEGNAYSWHGDGNFLHVKIFKSHYNALISHVSFEGYAKYKKNASEIQHRPENSVGFQSTVFSAVYLRGGGLDYNVTKNNDMPIHFSDSENEVVAHSDSRGDWLVSPIPLADLISPRIS